MAKFFLKRSAAEIDFLGQTIACLIVNLAVIFLVIILHNNLPPVVPLFYGQPKGEDQLALQSFLLLPPIAATIIIIINTLLSKFIKDHFLQRVIFGLSVLTTLLSTVTVIRIIILVGSF